MLTLSEPNIVLMLVILRGKETDKEIEYSYLLMYQGQEDYRHPSVLTKNLSITKEFRKRIIEIVTKPSRTISELKNLGKQLYQGFIPDCIREEIRRLDSDLRFFPTILIVTDDHEIPWEFTFDEEFWCLKYPMGRILGGPTRHFEKPVPPLDIIKLRSNRKRNVAVVVPNIELPGAREEARIVSEMLRNVKTIGEVVVLSRDKATEFEIRKVFASGKYDIFHYAGHARSFGADIDEERSGKMPAKLLLHNDFLTNGMIQNHQFTNKPIVFLNACETASGRYIGHTTESLATAFIQAGASGVVGTLWKIGDSIAAKFAEEFYKGIMEEKPFGYALMEAKRKLSREKEFRTNPDWNAYVIYGFPTRKMLMSSNITQIVIEMADEKGTLAKVVNALSKLEINFIGSRSLTYKTGEKAGYIAEIELPEGMTFKRLREQMKKILSSEVLFRVKEI